MKIVRDKNQHNDFEKILSSFIIEEKNAIFKNNIDLFRTSNAFRFKNEERLNVVIYI